MSLPNIEHTTVTLNERGRVIVQMDAGWVFYDKRDYVDMNGEQYTPSYEEISYFRYGVFSPQTDIENVLVVVDETTINPDQIYGDVKPPTEIA